MSSNNYARAVICVLVRATKTLATVYYIASSGNDAYTGTSLAQAWRTTAKILTTNFQPGDSIVFEGGTTFDGRIYFATPLNGTVSHPITFSSFSTFRGRRAKIFSGSGPGFYAENCSGIKITNLNFEGSGRTTNTDRGISLVVRLAGNLKKENIAIDSLEISGYKWAGIAMSGAVQRSGLANVTITNCEVHDNGDAGIVSDGVWDPSLSGYNHRNITIARCKVYNNSGVPGKGAHSGNGIVLAFVDQALIEYCESYNNGWLNEYTGGGPVGIWCWESNNVTIQFNESHHNKTGSNKDGGGFDFDGGTSNSLMQYNYAHDNAGPGYLLAQFEGARTLKNVTIRYNISAHDNSGVLLWSTGSNGGIRNADIYNNTIYTRSPLGGVAIISDYIYATRILNNIIQTTSGAYPVRADSTPDVKFMGNCYWSSGNDFAIQWGRALYRSLETWRNATDQEMLPNQISAGVQVDPMLQNPGQGVTLGNTDLLHTLVGYKLKAESKLINAGLSLSTNFGINPGSRDFFDTPLPQRAFYDIGAHEYESQVPVESSPQNENEGVFIFPNPSRKSVVVDLRSRSHEPVVVSVYNTVGEIVKQMNESEFYGLYPFAISLTEQPAGIYFICYFDPLCCFYPLGKTCPVFKGFQRSKFQLLYLANGLNE
jgi:hypothetical protein